MGFKLRTNDSHKFGKVNNIYPVGKIKISEEGIIEVESEEIAYEIANSEIGFSIIEKGVETISNTVSKVVADTSTGVDGTTVVVLDENAKNHISDLENKVKQLTENNSNLEIENKDLKAKLEESIALNEELGQMLEATSVKEEEKNKDSENKEEVKAKEDPKSKGKEKPSTVTL